MSTEYGNFLLPIPLAAETPDVPGGMLALAQRLDLVLGSARSVADLTELAAIPSTEIVGGAVALVEELQALFVRNAANTLWRQAGIARFATTSARDTAYAKASGAFLVSGVARCVVLDGTLAQDSVWVYHRRAASGLAGWRLESGQATILPNNSIGMTQIANGSFQFTNQSSVALTGCFDSSFRSYEVEIQVDSAANPLDLYVQFGNGGSFVTTASYAWSGINVTAAGASSGIGSAAQSYVQVGRAGVAGSVARLLIARPAQAFRTHVLWQSFDSDGVSRSGGGYLNNANPYTDLFIGSRPTVLMSGQVRIYGRAD